jgi:hypothetical protein
VFRTNFDLKVIDACENNSRYLGTSDRNDTGLDRKEVFIGECSFQVKEIEMFTIHVDG